LEAAHAKSPRPRPITPDAGHLDPNSRWWPKTSSASSSGTRRRPAEPTSRAGRCPRQRAAAGDGVRVARERAAQPRPCSGTPRPVRSRCGAVGPRQAGFGPVAQAQPARPGQAQFELHQDRGSGRRIITRKSVEIDQNVAAGRNLLTLVSLEDLWVTRTSRKPSSST